MLVNQPDLFRRMFPLHHDDVWDLVHKVHPVLNTGKRPRADRVPTCIKVLATLRLLAGGSYLDIAFMIGLPVGSFYDTVQSVIVAIDSVVDNIAFSHLGTGDPNDPEVLRHLYRLAEMERGFSRGSGDKFYGTVAAGDGLLLKILRPTSEV